MLRETLLIRRQSRADNMMHARKAKLTHFAHRLARRPSFCRHPIRRDHHARPIVPQSAVHKYPFVRIFLKQLQESCEDLVTRHGTVPRNRDILHSAAAHLFPFAAAPVATRVHDNVDPQFRQRPEPFMVWLPSAKKGRCYFTEIANAPDFPRVTERACGMRMRCETVAFVLRPFAGTHRDHQQYRDGECLQAGHGENRREQSHLNPMPKTELCGSKQKARSPGPECGIELAPA